MDTLINILRVAWYSHPHLRFGQLISNALVPEVNDIFHMDDKETLRRLNAYLNDHVKESYVEEAPAAILKLRQVTIKKL
jgi:hypothetical protein